MVKNLPANAGDIRDLGLIPESGRFTVERHSNPLQCSCLETPHGVIFLPGDAPASVHLNSNILYLVLLLSQSVQMT